MPRRRSRVRAPFSWRPSPRTRSSSAACVRWSGIAANGDRPSCRARKKKASSSPTTSTRPSRSSTIPSHRALALFRGRTEGILRLTVTLPDADGATAPTTPCGASPRASASRTRAGLPTLARRDRPLGLEIQADGAFRARRRAAASRSGRSGSHSRLRSEPPRSAARRACRPARHDGPGSRASARASRWRSSTEPESCSTPPPSIRISRETTGTARSRRSRRSAPRITCSSSRSATAPPREKPKSSSAISLARHPELSLTTGGRVGSRRVGLLRLGARRQGVSQPRRLAARRRIDRAAIAGSARRTRPHRAAGDRRRPVSARCQPGAARAGSSRPIVEDCVNAVGADVNTASAPLLARISGLNESLATNIVSFRDTHGPFRNRRQLLKVSRVGERAFQQAAGFLRITSGENPLDASAVHPEAYPVVERIASRTGVPVKELIGKTAVLRALKAGGVCRRTVRCADGKGHPRRAREAGARSPPGVQDGRLQGQRAGHPRCRSRA